MMDSKKNDPKLIEGATNHLKYGNDISDKWMIHYYGRWKWAEAEGETLYGVNSTCCLQNISFWNERHRSLYLRIILRWSRRRCDSRADCVSRSFAIIRLSHATIEGDGFYHYLLAEHGVSTKNDSKPVLSKDYDIGRWPRSSWRVESETLSSTSSTWRSTW